MTGGRVPALLFMLAAIGGALGLCACGSGAPPGTITSIEVTPSTSGTSVISVPINSTFQFTATVTLSDSSTSTTTAVTWEVNGVAGGNSTTGTIVPLSTDNQVGVYTAPRTVPTTNNGQVDITATATQSTSNTTASSTITSNTVVVQIGVTLGVTLTPTTVQVGAGGTQQFTAISNNVADPNATWSLSAPNGGNIGNIGTISATGLYTAPPFPPLGATVTVTATDATITQGPNTATATVTVFYSDLSLSGPYAFSYQGDDQSGFIAVAGSFVADGKGHFTSGIEDEESLLSGIFTTTFEAPAGSNFPGTYLVGPDGRVSATVNTSRDTAETWQFALTSNKHAVLIRFSTNVTGSGTIDQQSSNDLTTSDSTISGAYAFGVSGLNASFNPLAMAGLFTADGAGHIPSAAAPNTIADITQPGAAFHSTASLTGSYQFDGTALGTGRGTLSLTNGVTGTQQFAFYSFGNGTRMHLVETDGTLFMGGDAYAGPGAASLNLANANYAFTTGGNSSASSFASGYSAGGVFTSNGSGMVTAGVVDSNNAGTVTLGTTLTACAYTVQSATGRIDLKLCPSAGATQEYAVYQTSQGSAVMIEIDGAAVATGLAFQQSTTAAFTAGQFVTNLAGQGLFHNASALFQQNVEGEFSLALVGNLDVNPFKPAPFQSDALCPIAGNTSDCSPQSSLASPSGTTGRGTASPASAPPLVLSATSPDFTYNLVYYTIDANTALLFDQDKAFFLTGILARQF